MRFNDCTTNEGYVALQAWLGGQITPRAPHATQLFAEDQECLYDVFLSMLVGTGMGFDDFDDNRAHHGLYAFDFLVGDVEMPSALPLSAADVDGQVDEAGEARRCVTRSSTLGGGAWGCAFPSSLSCWLPHPRWNSSPSCASTAACSCSTCLPATRLIRLPCPGSMVGYPSVPLIPRCLFQARPSASRRTTPPRALL